MGERAFAGDILEALRMGLSPKTAASTKNAAKTAGPNHRLGKV